MEGFIQLHKKICEWEWYTDIPTCKLFFHILLKCNYKEAKWRGIEVKQGDFITSFDHLAKETGLSIRQVRTALEHLETTGEVTKQSTSQYTILTLTNWGTYNIRDDKPSTNGGQTDDKPSTTTNKNNKEYKENKENNIDTTIVVGEQALENKSDPDINNIIEVIKGQVEFLGLIYKKGSRERERAKNILTGKDFGQVCENANMSRIEFCKSIIYMSSKLDFWNGKINNAETLYKHYAQVYNEAVNLKAKKQKDTSLITF